MATTTTQEQSPTPPQLEICQKCGNSIAHVPYKFNNQTFHAVCLKCNFCGKKLVGKPFITEESKIFCGEQCKKDFETTPCSELSPNSEDTEGEDSIDESLLEALESIKESNQELLKLSNRGSPPIIITDPDRLTDYPRSSSPDPAFSPLNGSRRSSPLNGSRRSSLSAVSDCSLTSEGSSMSFDASGKPRKNILKNPHRSRRRSRNNRHVRWNLPNGGTNENDSDTTSLESFNSTSTTSSSIYNRARNGVAESRRNWKEHDPPMGSTGLTPARQIPGGSYRRMGSPSHSPLHVNSFGGIPRISSNELLGGFRRSPSPLTTVSPSHSPQHSYDSSTVVHSTPVRQQCSESSRLTNSNRCGNDVIPAVHSPERSMQEDSFFSHDESAESSFKIPVLKLNESSLPELENSTVEDKKRAHIVDLTQCKNDPKLLKYPAPSELTKSQPATHLASTTTALLNDDDDDADDYDHLNPLTEEELAAMKKERSLRKAHRAMKKQMLQKQKESKIEKKSELFSDEHINEALREIEVEDVHSTKAISPVADIAPPLPPRGEQLVDIDLPHERSSESPQLSHQSLSSASQKETQPEPPSLQHPTNVDTSKKTAAARKPPPVPPKHRRILRQQRDCEGNPVLKQEPAATSVQLRGKFKPLPPLPEDASHPKESHPTKAELPRHNRDNQAQLSSPKKPRVREQQENRPSPKRSRAKQDPGIPSKWKFEDSSDLANILPPPPEFVIPPPSEFAAATSQGNTPPDDSLSTVSNTTLVADQDEISSPDTSESLRQSLPDLISETARTSHSRDSVSTPKVGGLSTSAQQLHKSKHSWSAVHSAKTTDWKVEEARIDRQEEEEFESLMSGRSEPVLDTQGSSRYRQKSSGRLVKSVSHDADSASYRHNHAPQPPRYRVSMEKAFTEGKIVKSSTFSQTASHSPQSHLRRGSEQASRLAGSHDGARLKRTTSSPQRPLRHPKVADAFSREDQQVIERFYPGARLPMMKRVVHDTDRSIQAMLAELESDKEGSGDEKQSRASQHGTCSVCSKAIRTTRELISHEGYHYHSKCYKCSSCRSTLRGKKVHRVRNSIVCRDCYPTFGISNTQSSTATRRPDQQQASSYLPYHDLRRGPVVASGQVTSV